MTTEVLLLALLLLPLYVIQFAIWWRLYSLPYKDGEILNNDELYVNTVKILKEGFNQHKKKNN